MHDVWTEMHTAKSFPNIDKRVCINIVEYLVRQDSVLVVGQLQPTPHLPRTFQQYICM